jgi:hypothetical protein
MPLSARAEFVAKNGEWESQLYTWIRHFIHTTRVASEFEHVFVQPRSARSEFSRSFGPRRIGAVTGDATQEIAALARDVAEHWNSLDNDLKLRLQRIFSVRQDGKSVKVGLS